MTTSDHVLICQSNMKYSYSIVPVLLISVIILICLNGYRVSSGESSRREEFGRPETITDGKTPWKDCGSVVGMVSSVAVTGCNSNPCHIHKGTNIGTEVVFSPKNTVDVVTTVVHGIIRGMTIPLPFPSNTCDNQGLTCPIQAGSQHKFNSTIPVKSTYPSLNLTVRLELQDASKRDIVCVDIPLQVET